MLECEGVEEGMKGRVSGPELTFRPYNRTRNKGMSRRNGKKGEVGWGDLSGGL